MAKSNKPRTVTGRVEASSVQSHWDGWNGALDKALGKTGWKAGNYTNVQIEFYANVDVVNPGSIVEYAVKLIPPSG